MISLDEAKQVLANAGVEVPADISDKESLYNWLITEERNIDSKIQPEMIKLRAIRGIRELLEAEKMKESQQQ